MQARLAHAILFVADMDKAVAFYRDTFGLTLKFATPFWSEFDTGPTTLALHPASEANPPGRVQLGFTTPDLPGVFADRAASGLAFTQEPVDEHATLLSRILDCEGAEVSLAGAHSPE
jgi:catechol 2,3-dioxygenase-like lactoylglutathione lyase family enzyme